MDNSVHVAAGENSDIQSQLREVLSELKNQREEVQPLKEELQGSTFNVAVEVKKLKTDLSWKYQGNKIQYEFNEELDEIAKQINWALEHSKFDYSKELLQDLRDKLKKRNKLIRIADSSASGWDTVRLYEANPNASDSDDETKIYKAENRALKRKRSSTSGKTASATSGSRFGDSGIVPPSRPWSATAHALSFYSKAFSCPIRHPSTLPGFRVWDRAVFCLVESTTTYEDSAHMSTEQLTTRISPQRTNQTSRDLKGEYCFDSDHFTNDYYEYEQGQKHIIVRDRLKKNIQFLRDIGANVFVLDVIENG